jgi:epoxyqueuosine reductase QueG
MYSYSSKVLKVSNAAKAFTQELKNHAKELGVKYIGIVLAESIDAVPSHWVGWEIQKYTQKTKEVMEDAKSVVVLGYYVWDDIFETAVRRDDGSWMYPGYFPLSWQTWKVADFLEKKGYKVVAFPPLISLKRLAQLAGFGNFGKNALIINPEVGPWLRFGAVLTNACLVADKPFERDLCGDCNACVEACPTKALTPYKVDDSKCLVGIHLRKEQPSGLQLSEFERFEPRLTVRAHLMCRECQKVCKYNPRKQE